MNSHTQRTHSFPPFYVCRQDSPWGRQGNQCNDHHHHDYKDSLVDSNQEGNFARMEGLVFLFRIEHSDVYSNRNSHQIHCLFSWKNVVRSVEHGPRVRKAWVRRPDRYFRTFVLVVIDRIIIKGVYCMLRLLFKESAKQKEERSRRREMKTDIPVARMHEDSHP